VPGVGWVPPADVMRLMEAIESDGGAVIGPYREPLGGLWQVMAALPVELVEPTPYQRDLPRRTSRDS
jgi:ParB family chromosome partitioning protein